MKIDNMYNTSSMQLKSGSYYSDEFLWYYKLNFIDLTCYTQV